MKRKQTSPPSPLSPFAIRAFANLSAPQQCVVLLAIATLTPALTPESEALLFVTPEQRAARRDALAAEAVTGPLRAIRGDAQRAALDRAKDLGVPDAGQRLERAIRNATLIEAVVLSKQGADDCWNTPGEAFDAIAELAQGISDELFWLNNVDKISDTLAPNDDQRAEMMEQSEAA